MKRATLSIFIDESGDYGPYSLHSPYYIVSLTLHNQADDISLQIARFDEYLANIGKAGVTVHSGPLIRAEGLYKTEGFELRKQLFNALFNLGRHIPVSYMTSITVKRKEYDSVALISVIARNISSLLRVNANFFNNFTKIIVYYDNGQIELTKILSSIFNSMFTHVEFRKVRPCDYKLFQLSDMACTMTLLKAKYDHKTLTNSELRFFGGYRSLHKNYLKAFARKILVVK